MSEPVRHLKAISAGLAALAVVLAGAEAQVLENLRTGERLEPSSRERSFETEPTPSAAPETSSEAWSVHLASYFTEEDAVLGWDVLLLQYGDVLARFEPILASVDLGERGVFVRLLAGPLQTRGEAEELCDRMQSVGAYCVPADGAGRFLVSTDRFDK